MISSQLRAITLHLTFAPKNLNVLKLPLPPSIALQSLPGVFLGSSERSDSRATIGHSVLKAWIQNPELPGGQQWHSSPVEILAVPMGQLSLVSEHHS